MFMKKGKIMAVEELDPPFFSIVVACYNRRDCVSNCLFSVMRQEFSDWEMVVVDDASADGSADVVAEIASRDRRISLVRLPENLGPAGARNRAICVSRGRFILILDSDDRLADGALGTIAGFIERNGGFRYYLFAVSDMLERYREFGLPADGRVAELNYRDWLSGRVAGDFTHVVERDVILRHPFDEELRIYEDFFPCYKETQVQLFCGAVAAERDRFRADSVTREACFYRRRAWTARKMQEMRFLNACGDDVFAVSGLDGVSPHLENLFLSSLLDGDRDAWETAEKLAAKYGFRKCALLAFVKAARLRAPFSVAVAACSYLKNRLLYR
ncbi:MAG: glycosyltransferase [Victivallaceae bacterium]|nr:glycosyltransferase [Victivallaceae bacterium]